MKTQLRNDLLPTLAAFVFMINVTAHFTTFCFVVYVLFCTSYWPLMFLMACWTIYDRHIPRRGGRKVQQIRDFWVWKWLRLYFPVSLVKTVDLDPEKNYIFGTHPHGLVTTSTILNFMVNDFVTKQLFPGLKFHTATLEMNFYFPILRDYFLSIGLVSASSNSLRFLLDRDKSGNVVNLVVGGAAESQYSITGEYKIILKKRKGFVKIALTTGCSLVPVMCFGENDIFQLLQPPPDSILSTLQSWIKKITGVRFCVPVGRSWLFKFLPRRVPLVTVVGRPIELPKVAEPTQEQIDHYHSLYTKELITLFNEYKYKYVSNPETTDLIIVE